LPSWNELLRELKDLIEKKHPNAVDHLRRKYMAQLNRYTNRNVVLYATRWTQPTPNLPAGLISITDEDIQGLMEVFHDLPSGPLDIVIHSPEGSAEATEAMVSYIRSRFTDVRVIIPHAAMSAATMLACSANRLVMGKHSFLGPIDPQMILNTELGIQAVPAQAIIDQFNMAKDQCRNLELLAAWSPMLPQYGPALLIQCQETLELSRELVTRWLTSYMFHGEKDAEQKAGIVAECLADHKRFKTHLRHIGIDEARSYGLIIDDLGNDKELNDLVLSVFYATSITFDNSPAVKIVESHLGRAYMRLLATRRPPPQQAGRPAAAPAAPSPPPPPNT